MGAQPGDPLGGAVLNIDRKEGGPAGLATLGKIDCPILPLTPTVYTPSGGMHLYFTRPEGGLRNTNGERGRGIGPGLDWRGDGGYVILPSPGSGYRWDKRLHFGRYAPCAIPETLFPKSPRIVTQAPTSERPPKRAIGLSPYGEAALDKAARALVNPPAGEPEATFNS